MPEVHEERKATIKTQALADKFSRGLVKALQTRDFRPVLDLFLEDVVMITAENKSQGREPLLVYLKNLPKNLSVFIESPYPNMVSFLLRFPGSPSATRLVFYTSPDVNKFNEVQIPTSPTNVHWGG